MHREATLSNPSTKDARRAAGPRGAPFIGVIPQVRRDPLGFFLKASRDYGDVVEFTLAGKRVVMFNDPGLIEQILRKDYRVYRKSKYYQNLTPLLGNGFLTSEGDTWLKQRRTAKPAFGGAAIKNMLAAMDAESEAMLATWPADGSGAAIDVSREMMRITLSIAVRTLFGMAIDDHTAERLSRTLTIALRDAEARIWSAANVPQWIPTPHNRRVKAAIQDAEDVFKDIVERRRSATERHDDLLDMLIDTYGDDTRELRDLIISILFAGHETTAAALSWTFYLLAQYPSWAEAIRREAREVIDGREMLDMQSVQDLVKTRACFEEAMRLYPPVWTFSRDALEDHTVGDCRLRRGDTAMICAYALHRHPKYWNEPEVFQPERFLLASERDSRSRAFLPFGDGPRTCLGNRFAMTEAAIILAKSLLRFDLDLVEGHPVEAEPMITLRPRHGMLMRPRPVSQPRN